MLDILEAVDHAGQAEAGPKEGEAEDGAEGEGHETRGAGCGCCYVVLTVRTLYIGWLWTQLWHRNLAMRIF